ncbi:tetratricopeptide repeat protein [Planktotalea sp.]|uniref:tetratricopeptide repeat protein n=1 Tax=Planktotalea sp. TaxID=2029877 RepID=UPI003D6BDA25
MTRLVLICQIVLVCFALFSAAQPALAQSNSKVQLTPNEMRVFAADAVIKGQPKLGYQIASALLQRNPNDTEALIIRARAARDLGLLPEAVATARRAWGLARTSSERFGASMVMAQSLSTSGAKTRAQNWLRRAAQNAPSEEFKNVAIRDFRYVRRTNPWATEFSFSVSPNSNINNGSKHSSTRLFDLPLEFELTGAARALAGLEYTSGLATRYRLFESQRSQHDLVLRLDHKTYTMTDDAKRLSPTSKGSDFAFSSASLSYIKRGFSGSGNELPHQFELTAGRTWYGNAPFMQYLRFGFTQNMIVAPGRLMFAGLTHEHQRSMSNRQDVDIWGGSAGLRLKMANQDNLSMSLHLKKSSSLDPSLDYLQLSLRTRYALAKPIAGVSIDFGVSFSQKNHDLSRYSRFGRTDKTLSIDATGVISRIEYFGFSPSVTVSASKTDSSINLFDSESLGLRVGIQSSF